MSASHQRRKLRGWIVGSFLDGSTGVIDEEQVSFRAWRGVRLRVSRDGVAAGCCGVVWGVYQYDPEPPVSKRLSWIRTVEQSMQRLRTTTSINSMTLGRHHPEIVCLRSGGVIFHEDRTSGSKSGGCYIE